MTTLAQTALVLLLITFVAQIPTAGGQASSHGSSDGRSEEASASSSSSYGDEGSSGAGSSGCPETISGGHPEHRSGDGLEAPDPAEDTSIKPDLADFTSIKPSSVSSNGTRSGRDSSLPETRIPEVEDEVGEDNQMRPGSSRQPAPMVSSYNLRSDGSVVLAQQGGAKVTGAEKKRRLTETVIISIIKFNIYVFRDRKSTRLNSSHRSLSRMPSSA